MKPSDNNNTLKMQRANNPACISVHSPDGLGCKLLFQAFFNGIPVGHASLRKTVRKPRFYSSTSSRPIENTTYTLSNIHVDQNYRQLGIGSSLLNEVIQFCETQQIHHLVGQIKSDIANINDWYSQHGFKVYADNTMEITRLSPRPTSLYA